MDEPDYYSSNGLSPLQAFEQGLMSKEEYIGFLKGNVIKYTVRAGKKDDPLMDIFKAIDYLYHLHKALSDDENSDVESNVKTKVAHYPVDFNDPAFEERSILKMIWGKIKCKLGLKMGD